MRGLTEKTTLSGVRPDGLDVLHRQAPRPDALHAAEVGIVAHPHAVDFHGGAEGSVTGGRAAGTQREGRIGRQVGVEGLPARQQRRHAAHAVHLQVVQCRPFDFLGRVDVVLGLLGRHDDLVQGQGIDREGDDQVFNACRDGQFPGIGHIAEAGDLQVICTFLHPFQFKFSFQPGDGPEIVLVQFDDGSGHRFPCPGVLDRATHPQRGRGGQRQDGHQEEEDQDASFHDILRNSLQKYGEEYFCKIPINRYYSAGKLIPRLSKLSLAGSSLTLSLA